MRMKTKNITVKRISNGENALLFTKALAIDVF